MTQTNRHAAQIEHWPFFQAAGATVLTDLLAASFTQLLPRNAVLFEQGEEPQILHLLLEGRIGLQTTAEAGTRTIVEIFGPGEIVLLPAVGKRKPTPTFRRGRGLSRLRAVVG